MIEPRDEELSRIYRDADAPEPAQRVDDAILAASRRAAGARPRPAGFGFARRWGTPVALAATVVVTFTLTLMVFERQSGVDTMAPAATSADQPARSSPTEPRRAGQLAQSPREEAKPAAPARPIPQAADRRDRAQQGLDESAASSERLGTGQPAFVPEVPRAPEALRKSEEAAPAPAAAAPSANFYSSERAVADQPAPAAAPAAGASGLRESKVRGAGVVSGIASRVAAPEAKERAPKKWLEDIRKLKTEGKATEAERELAEFKKRYPEYRLPEDLR
jgi:hypothetical protein